ncbi:MAG TPA: hypothetical protein VMJ32_09810 [Pirellulales bacterium]|nr:hypothetical protein [Pirellulales bacterium]
MASILDRPSSFVLQSPPRETLVDSLELASMPPARGPLNLILMAKRRRAHSQDFPAIAQKIRELAPDIKPIILTDRYYDYLWPAPWLRPALTVAPAQLQRYHPLRGYLCQNRLFKKSTEYALMEQFGVPVPRWALVTENQSPDLTGFGPYVVVKPDLGCRGAEVKIKRQGRVRWKPPANKMAVRRGNLDLIAQEFIYTGSWPVSYRVTTLFGRVLFSWKVEAARTRRPLSSPVGFNVGDANGGGMAITSSGPGCRFELCYDEDVLKLGQRAHAAFPNHPLLGFDIIRESPSAKLYVIEANSGGDVWHFSSATGLSIQRDNNLDFAAQFDGLRRAALTLIAETRRRAQ